MPTGLTPQVVDIPLLLPNQTPPKHAGPIGRLTSMVNAQIKHFLPSSAAAPQRITVEPRDGFAALTNVCRDSVTGALVTADWTRPQVLSVLGDQLLSICDGIPRIFNGATWTNYTSRRVVSNKLSQDVLHTTNRVLAASDSAYLGGVTCFVWTEESTTGPFFIKNSFVGFRGDDGAWVRTPLSLFSTTVGGAMARVVTDGTRFWVVFNTSNRLAIYVFDTNGVLLAQDTTTIVLAWTGNAPGYWDVKVFSNAGVPYVLIIQPGGFSAIGNNVDLQYSRCTVAGAVITIVTAGVTGYNGDCNGPCAFLENDVNSFPYVATAAKLGFLYVTELSHAGADTHSYQFGNVLAAGSQIPDSLTGWVEANGAGVIAHAAYSLLSNFTPPAGPANDPGLRYTRSYACTRADVTTLTNQVNGVLLSSRAFRVDGDWHAVTYYQGGSGIVSTPAVETIATDDTEDYFAGPANQPFVVSPLDYTTGADNVDVGAADLWPTQHIVAIAHTAGDSVVSSPASTATWTLAAAGFLGTGGGASTITSAQGAYLHIAGAANAQNNGDWWILSVTSGSVVVTESFSAQGTVMTNEAFGVGVTASVTQVWPVVIPIGINTSVPWASGNVAYPDADMIPKFIGGAFVIVGATGAGADINGTYAIKRITRAAGWRGTTTGFTSTTDFNTFFLVKTVGALGLDGAHYGGGTGYSSAVLSASPLHPNRWAFAKVFANDSTRVAYDLIIAGDTKAGNNGAFLATGGGGTIIDTATQPGQRAEMWDVPPPALPTASISLHDPSLAYVFHLRNASFDASYLNATLTMSGALAAQDNGVYEIDSVINATTVHVHPADGRTGQIAYDMTSGETITVARKAAAGAGGYQPCWFLTPLSLSQKVAGRWEWAIAFGDWRFDGNSKASLATLERNMYPLALSSVVAAANGARQVVLPYRAQSFTAGQTISNAQGGVVGVQSTSESTVGLKQFTISASPGLAVPNAGELIIPGAMAAQYTASGFTEDGINLGFEAPFLVSQTHDVAVALALSPLAKMQYVAVAEVTSESGDRIWSVVSPPLEVVLTGANNTVTLGGRMPDPTLRVLGVALYRTAMIGFPQVATIQHYKITNDLDVNGRGFTFTSVNGGASFDTWQFKDQVPDSTILSAETLYTDKALLQRFPAPAFSHGVANWEGRDWVIGYDGAVWMSGEKTEGDAIWFHPAFRYTAFGDDTPVALAAMETYLLVFCAKSIWLIPAVQFPDATGSNGALPTPQPLPFRNGCTGFAVTIKAGVAYSSTAGGVWLINRALQNLYLSEPMQDDLQLGITGMTVDGLQRLVVMTGSTTMFVFDDLSQGWLKWTLGAAASLVATWQKNATIQDASRVRTQTPGVFVDATDAALTGVAPDLTLAIVSLGTVKGLKRVWALNLTGDCLGPCRLFATLTYPDDADWAPQSFYGPFVITGAGVLNIEINPMVEETTSFVLHVFADFGGVAVPGASFSLELITAEAGIEPTMAKRPNSSRLPGS